MNEEEKKGSDLISGTPNANDNPEGTKKEPEGDLSKASDVDLSKYVPKDRYDELETKLGTQGKDLGDLRDFFKEISPLLEKLEERPEITDAILSGKLDANLAKAVLEGKVKVEDATTVAKAHEEVKKEVGKSEYKGLSAEEIEKLVSAKVEEMVSKKTEYFDKKLNSAEKLRERKEYEQDVVSFVASTSDYAEYADEINKFIDEHPNQYDIKVIYDAVKGRILGEKSKTDREKEQAEEAKKIASNAGGGGSQGRSIVADEKVVDELISSRNNPNNL